MTGDFFGGIFDFNRDGKTDISEQFLAFMMMQETMGQIDEDEDDLDDLDEVDDYED